MSASPWSKEVEYSLNPKSGRVLLRTIFDGAKEVQSGCNQSLWCVSLVGEREGKCKTRDLKGTFKKSLISACQRAKCWGFSCTACHEEVNLWESPGFKNWEETFELNRPLVIVWKVLLSLSTLSFMAPATWMALFHTIVVSQHSFFDPVPRCLFNIELLPIWTSTLLPRRISVKDIRAKSTVCKSRMLICNSLWSEDYLPCTEMCLIIWNPKILVKS